MLKGWHFKQRQTILLTKRESIYWWNRQFGSLEKPGSAQTLSSPQFSIKGLCSVVSITSKTPSKCWQKCSFNLATTRPFFTRGVWCIRWWATMTGQSQILSWQYSLMNGTQMHFLPVAQADYRGVWRRKISELQMTWRWVLTGLLVRSRKRKWCLLH